MDSFQPLPQLSEEILRQILDEMAPEDRAVMGLTNKSIMDRLSVLQSAQTTGGQATVVRPWENLQGDVRFRFLCAIEKVCDPHLIPCRVCLTLHLPSKCFPSPTNDPAHIRCATAPRFLGPHFPLRGQDIAQALYIFAKYRRHGFDLSFFHPQLTGQREEREVEHWGVCGSPNVHHLWPVVNRSRLVWNAQVPGLFWQHRSEHRITLHVGPNPPLSLPLSRNSPNSPPVRYIYPDHVCECGENVPCFDFEKLVRGNFRLAVLTMPQRLDNGGIPADANVLQDMLPPSHLSPSAGGVGIGPIVGCRTCRRDFRAHLEYPGPRDQPVLVLTTWAYLGPAASYAEVETALRTPWVNLPPMDVGKVAEHSGLVGLN